ncbi:ribbon-helix-helix domain-containing protein [Helicobacter pylori]|nr:ribbon-helix-helix domain-containing protein [Helicobacter pylori]
MPSKPLTNPLFSLLAKIEAELKENANRFNLSPSFMAKVDEYMKEKGFSNRSLLFEKALEFYMLKHP